MLTLLLLLHQSAASMQSAARESERERKRESEKREREKWWRGLSVAGTSSRALATVPFLASICLSISSLQDSKQTHTRVKCQSYVTMITATHGRLYAYSCAVMSLSRCATLVFANSRSCLINRGPVSL